MNLFRPGTPPPGVPVSRPVWPVLAPESRTAEVSVIQPTAPDLSRQAEAVLEQARHQAADLLTRAAEEAEAAVAAARAEGYEAGRQEGLAAARTEVELQRQQAGFEIEKARVQADALRQTAESQARAIVAEAESHRHSLVVQARDEVAALLEEGHAERRRMLDDSKEALVELAVAAAGRLVQGHLAVQPAAIVAMVGAGLRRLKESNCTVRVNPQDLPLLLAQRSVLERELGTGSLKLQADPGLTPGGHTITSSMGHLDASVEQQTNQLRTALKSALGGE